MNRTKTFEEILDTYDKIGITGGPNTGKSTLADRVYSVYGKFKFAVFHTDDYMPDKDTPRDLKNKAWSSLPYELKLMCAPYETLIIEGVQVARALRKGLDFDCLILMTQVKTEQTKQQESMTKGIITILNSFEITIPVYIEEGENEFVNYTGFQEWLREKYNL